MEETRYLEVANLSWGHTQEGSEQHHMLHPHERSRRKVSRLDMYIGLVGGLLFASRAALLACVSGLAFLVRVCRRWFPALVSDCLYMPSYCVSL